MQFNFDATTHPPTPTNGITKSGLHGDSKLNVGESSICHEQAGDVAHQRLAV